MAQPSPTDLYRRATTDALASPKGFDLISSTCRRRVRLGPCRTCSTTWSAAPLPRRRHRRHRASPRHGRPPADFRAGVDACLAASAIPARCRGPAPSPLGFDWTVLEATAGTFMDTLIHTWDLATATGQTADLDPELVDACAAMFLPDMPERGRAAGSSAPPSPWPTTPRPGPPARRHGPHAVTDRETDRDRLQAIRTRGPPGDAAPRMGRRTNLVRAGRRRRPVPIGGQPAPQGPARRRTRPRPGRRQPPPLPGRPRASRQRCARSSTSSGATTSTPSSPPPRRCTASAGDRSGTA